ncbi:UNVERIFIED_CONTAM: hypothetical protein PYX00_010665 [Menopon gallinae]|uniref:RRM domain-containing protein n=1 Tax=Menopon gallinae TaxID=328185 RepID=A0AAW2HGF9_9NEOP
MEVKNGPSKGTAGIRGKDDDKKLFVGGLPKPCTENELRDTFSKFGTIESINIKKDTHTGLPRGFCFIVFSESYVVDQILASGDIYINGKKVDPRKVTKSTTPGKVFVGGLTSEFTEEKLKEYFGTYGTITEIQWPIDRQKNQKKAYCFLTFENRECVTEVLKKPKQIVCGKEVDVKKVKHNPEVMWQYGGAYATRGGRGTYTTTYPSAFSNYEYDYSGEYAASNYEDYYPSYGDYYYDYAPAYETYAPGYPSAYATRAPRGGRTTGSYTRHAPY